MSKTTIIGGILSTVQFANIDLSKLGNGDHGEIVKLISAVLMGALGFFAQDQKGPPAHQ